MVIRRKIRRFGATVYQHVWNNEALAVLTERQPDEVGLIQRSQLTDDRSG